MHWAQKLMYYNACTRALKYCCKYDTFEEAWNECRRVDWLSWYVTHVSPATYREVVTCGLEACRAMGRYEEQTQKVQVYLDLVEAGNERELLLWVEDNFLTVPYIASCENAVRFCHQPRYFDNTMANLARFSPRGACAIVRKHFPAAEMEKHL